MTKQIRKNVFETNSSSSHSLTMSASDVVTPPFSKQILRDGVMPVSVGEYGWEYFRYYTVENKVSYLLTQITSGSLPTSRNNETLTAELREQHEKFDMLCKVVKAHTGVDIEVQPGSGYVDHDSEGVGMNLFQSEDVLHKFLFSDSYIETSNDNDGPPVNISTDRGASEAYYIASYATVPADFVKIEVAMKGYWNATATSSAGKVIDQEGDIWEKIIAQGIVTNVDWTVAYKGYNAFEYSEPRAYTMGKLSGLGGETEEGADIGIKFTEDLKVQVKKEGDKDDENMDIVIHIPAALAAAYQEAY